MKKIVSILLAATLACGLLCLTGCGENGNMTTSTPSGSLTAESSDTSRESESSSRESSSAQQSSESKSESSSSDAASTAE